MLTFLVALIFFYIETFYIEANDYDSLADIAFSRLLQN